MKIRTGKTLPTSYSIPLISPLNLLRCRHCPQPAPEPAPQFRWIMPGILFMCPLFLNASTTSFCLRPQETAPPQSGSGLPIEKNRSAPHACDSAPSEPAGAQCPHDQRLTMASEPFRSRVRPIKQSPASLPHTRPAQIAGNHDPVSGLKKFFLRRSGIIPAQHSEGRWNGRGGLLELFLVKISHPFSREKTPVPKF